MVRYEHPRPGALIHLRLKRLARIAKPGHRVHGDRARGTRGAGWEYLRIAIDDHSRISYAAILHPGEPCSLGWKAERFPQTAPREWAYGRTYQHSAERTEQLEAWLHDYNFHRPHSSLGLKSPASRAGLNRNNLLMLHS